MGSIMLINSQLWVFSVAPPKIGTAVETSERPFEGPWTLIGIFHTLPFVLVMLNKSPWLKSGEMLCIVRRLVSRLFLNSY